MTDIPAVRCTGLNQRFGSTLAVDDLDLEVSPGETFGLLGPNGAGKTTTIRMITTLLPPSEGSIEVFGVDVARRRTAVRRLIGYVPQQLSADATLTGRENVALFARLYDVPRRGRRARVDEVLEAVALADVADRSAKTYSGGMVRRLELAQALVSAPKLLILDEPTVGLDPVARDGVWSRIEEIQRDTGMTVLVTTHLMQEADQRCDRVALMHRGRVEVLGSPSQLRGTLGEDATLDDVFRAYTGDRLDDASGSMRDVRAARRTARRVS
ncbi:ABC transporter ATP-binding protein [Pseudonocardia spinosispora]|uniref:ABC transporter ATP-binding protein n=1 Tax=Pseudonocardia spinosispora TaxID=103441 RepID=UPI00040D1F54|nr:ATP-binding cassette domain-containing protein [Pseudonocardia spinosispora]